jgi:chromosome segregation ATPase
MGAPVNSPKNEKFENRTSDIEDLKIEFETTKRLLAEKEKLLKKVHSEYHPFLHRIEELKQSRDRLNEKNKKTRKDIKDTTDYLRRLEWVLSQNVNEADAVRAEIESAKRKAKPFDLPYQQAHSEYLKLQKHLDELNKKIKEAEVRAHPYSINRIWSEVSPIVGVQAKVVR